jgi:sulfur-oxidizing protein SoxX
MRSSTIRTALAAVLATGVAAAAADAAPRKVMPDREYYGVSRMAPLTDKAGDPVNGKVVVRTKGLCLSCHTAPIPEEPDHGDVAPDLAGVGSRLQPPELRMRIADPKVVFPDTIMPSFLKKQGLNRVAAAWEGQTILTPQEIEDVVAYLSTLK